MEALTDTFCLTRMWMVWRQCLFSQVPLLSHFSKTNIICNMNLIYSRKRKRGIKSRLYNLGPLKYVCGGMLFKLHANDKQNLFKKRKDEKHIHSNTPGACVSQTSSATLQGEATVCWPLHFANT